VNDGTGIKVISKDVIKKTMTINARLPDIEIGDTVRHTMNWLYKPTEIIEYVVVDIEQGMYDYRQFTLEAVGEIRYELEGV